MKKLLMIIPAFNEEESIAAVVDNIKDKYPQYDYLVVNDGSRDMTENVCKEKGYNYVSHPVNLGLAGAFQTGMKYAYRHGYDYAIQIDADGQHDPKYIAPMMDKAEEGYDIVIGSRFVTEKKPHSMRMLGSNLIQCAIRVMSGHSIKDPTSGMRLYGKNVLREFATNINYGPEPDTISFLVEKGVKVAEVQVHMEDRIAGQSYLTITKSMSYMARMLISIVIMQKFRKRG
jgi:glycosyltransferase involved in cell wall biosynthesis